MSLNSFKMMMESGVLRPGYLEIRRIPVGPSAYSSDHVPQLLDHLFGTKLRPAVTPNEVTKTANFSIGVILRRLGILSPANREPRREPLSPQTMITRLRERVRTLESLLKAEQARCQAQDDELVKLRAHAARAEQLQAELSVERESAEILVQWLQEAEHQLANGRGLRLGAAEGSRNKIR